MGGYFGKLLVVDLDDQSQRDIPLDESLLKTYIGGSGLGARLLYDCTSKDTAPLSGENVLIFATGPFTGTRIPSSGRHALVSKSPLTGIWAESDVGGRWGTRLKSAGIDALMVKGAADRPVAIAIENDAVTISDANHLWGMDAYATSALLKKAHDPKVEICAIGKAGENRVPLASVMHDGRHGRAAGRCGLGAVMGAKRLKAIVVSGDQKTPVAHPGKLTDLIRQLHARIRKSSAYLRQYGTAGGMMCLESSGDMPVKNFLRGSWANAEKITGEALAQKYLKGRFACGACPIGCGREVAFQEKKYAVVRGAGPEYESLAAFGSYCLIDDLAAVCVANDLCNRYGMDTISVGAVIAFAMEAFERGVITAGDLGGMALRWGDADAMIEMIRLIGENNGFGRVLGMGVRAAAKALGPETQDLALHVKGLELPAHDPRAYFSSAVSYATANRGACHLAGLTHALENTLSVPELGYAAPLDRFAALGKGIMAAKMQNLMGMFDALKICKFLLYTNVTVTDLVRCLNRVTDWDFTVDQFLQTGERLFVLKRLYNIRCGVARTDDVLPARLSAPLKEGGAKGRFPDLAAMRSEYYAFRKWDENGVPAADKLRELGLGEAE
jgi:aldehyde:ferredoxin oxidoreductase